MAFVFLVIGIIFLVAAVRGKHELLFDTLKDDFTGRNNFVFWGLAFFLIGAIGYYKPARMVSNAFMVLLIVVILLSNEGFPRKFMEQLNATTRAR